MPKNLIETNEYTANIEVPTDGEAYNENVQDKALGGINNRVVNNKSTITNLQTTITKLQTTIESVSFWNVAPGGVNTGGRIEFQFLTSAYPGQGPGDVPFDTSAGIANRTFNFPRPPEGFALWEITAEIVISTINAVSGDLTILTYNDPDNATPITLVQYPFQAQSTLNPDVVIPIRTHLNMDANAFPNLAFSISDNGGDISINNGRLKIARVY